MLAFDWGIGRDNAGVLGLDGVEFASPSSSVVGMGSRKRYLRIRAKMKRMENCPSRRPCVNVGVSENMDEPDIVLPTKLLPIPRQ